MAVYSIWDQQTESGAATGFTGTLGTEFNLAEAASLTGIWVYSSTGATPLPSACAIYDYDTMTLVSGTLNNSPSWTGAAGSGWVDCIYDGSVSLTAGVNYAVAVYVGGTVFFSAYVVPGWPTVSGIIDATAGVYDTTSGGINFPETNAGSYTYWIDVEVTVFTPPPSPPLPFTGFMSSM